MLRTYFRLEMKDGSSLMVGDDWPEPNLDVRRAVAWLRQNGYADAGAALERAAGLGERRVKGTIWMIVFQPEVVENYSDADESFTKQVQAERYLLLMKDSNPSPDGRPHGKKTPGACSECKGVGCSSCPEETQVLEVPVADVKFAHRVQGFHDATDMFKDLINDMNEDLLPAPADDEDFEGQEEVDEEDKPNGKDANVTP